MACIINQGESLWLGEGECVEQSEVWLLCSEVVQEVLALFFRHTEDVFGGDAFGGDVFTNRRKWGVSGVSGSCNRHLAGVMCITIAMNTTNTLNVYEVRREWDFAGRVHRSC